MQKFKVQTFQLFKSILFLNPEKFQKDYVITYYADFGDFQIREKRAPLGLFTGIIIIQFATQIVSACV